MRRRALIKALASMALLPSLAWTGVKRVEAPRALSRHEEEAAFLSGLQREIEDALFYGSNRPEISFRGVAVREVDPSGDTAEGRWRTLGGG